VQAAARVFSLRRLIVICGEILKKFSFIFMILIKKESEKADDDDDGPQGTVTDLLI
jgi:hypothetical protein